VVSDPLDPGLDPATVSLGRIVFGSYHVDPSPGSRSYTTAVSLGTDLSVQVSLSLVGSQLVWSLDTFHPSGLPLGPTEGFLPPNDQQDHGQGSVQFTVRPRATVTNGTQIANQAVLTFDGAVQNTPTWLNTVDETPPTSHVIALGGTQTAPSFTVQWSADGSPPDLKDYTVCVREDNGPYRAWRTNTTALSDTFMASRTDHTLHTYSFYSIARDQVGNMEAPPVNPDYDAQTLSTTGVDPGLRWRLELGGARPNPARGSIHVWFTLANRESATLELIDIAGRRVTRREVGSLGAGPHLVNLAASTRLQSGIYFLRLIQGERVLTARVALVR
jgi:hypothetical protein